MIPHWDRLNLQEREKSSAACWPSERPRRSVYALVLSLYLPGFQSKTNPPSMVDSRFSMPVRNGESSGSRPAKTIPARASNVKFLLLTKLYPAWMPWM